MAKNKDNETPGDEPQVVAEKVAPVPFKDVTADKVLASHVGLMMDQRNLPYEVSVGQVVCDESLGHNHAFVVLDNKRKKGVIDVMSGGSVNLSALHGDVHKLATNPRIKVV